MLRRALHPLKNTRARLSVERLEVRLTPSITLGQQPGAPNNTQFHGDSLRTGFDQVETVLTPTDVASSFGQVWQSPQGQRISISLNSQYFGEELIVETAPNHLAS
jgi:hypothetical protein